MQTEASVGDRLLLGLGRAGASDTSDAGADGAAAGAAAAATSSEGSSWRRDQRQYEEYQLWFSLDTVAAAAFATPRHAYASTAGVLETTLVFVDPTEHTCTTMLVLQSASSDMNMLETLVRTKAIYGRR